MNNSNKFSENLVGQISLTGDLCSGKSTTCDLLTKSLGMTYMSIGTIFRKEAEEKGISILELNKQYEGTRNDVALDRKLFDLRSTDAIVIDARLGWFFVPESFKVFLKTKPSEIVRRARKSDRGNVEMYSNDYEAFKHLTARKQSELDRFNNLYFIDFNKPSNFDLVIDTTCKTPAQVTEEIIDGFKKFKENKIKFFNFNNLMPTQSVREINENYSKTCDREDPVVISRVDNFYWIIDGHHRAIKYKHEGNPVPCVIDNRKIVDREIRNLYDWEEAFKFRYTFYPF